MFLSMIIVSGFRFLNTIFVKEFNVEKEIFGFITQTILITTCITLIKVIFNG